MWDPWHKKEKEKTFYFSGFEHTHFCIMLKEKNQKLKKVRTETEFWEKIVSLVAGKKKVRIKKKKAQIVFKRPFHLLLQCMETGEMKSEGGSKAAPCLSMFWPGCRHTQSRFINLPHTIDV